VTTPRLPGKRRIRDQISAELLHDFDGFDVDETNWSGAAAINARAWTPDGHPFWFRVEITDVWEAAP
jgi:hypothetical protein